MIGCKLSATYIPVAPATFLTPDPSTFAWGDAMGIFTLGPDPDPPNSGWLGAIFEYNAGEFMTIGPNGPPSFMSCRYINGTDSASPAIQIVGVFGTTGFQNPFDMEALQTVFQAACADAATCLTMAAFSSSGAMQLEKTLVEMWSDEPTL